MMIDIDKLREEMRHNYLGAYFVGGFGAALIGLSEIEGASDEELIEMAQRRLQWFAKNYCII